MDLTCRKCKQSLIPPGTSLVSELPDLDPRILRNTDSALNAQAISRIPCPNCNKTNYILWEAKGVVDEQQAANFGKT